jgi:hypothetical protein
MVAFASPDLTTGASGASTDSPELALGGTVLVVLVDVVVV